YSNFNGNPNPATSSSQCKGGVVPCAYAENFSCFVRLLQFTEQSQVYNSINFNLNSSNNENLTISGVRLNILTCPSDPNSTPVQIQVPSVRGSAGSPGYSFNQVSPM